MAQNIVIGGQLWWETFKSVQVDGLNQHIVNTVKGRAKAAPPTAEEAWGSLRANQDSLGDMPVSFVDTFNQVDECCMMSGGNQVDFVLYSGKANGRKPPLRRLRLQGALEPQALNPRGSKGTQDAPSLASAAAPVVVGKTQRAVALARAYKEDTMGAIDKDRNYFEPLYLVPPGHDAGIQLSAQEVAALEKEIFRYTEERVNSLSSTIEV